MAALEVTPSGLLFVADSGVASIYSNPSAVCAAKIVVYDLNSDGDDELYRYTFPEAVVSGRRKNVLKHMVIDFYDGDRKDDDDRRTFPPVHVYLSDTTGGNLVVARLRPDGGGSTSWTVRASPMAAASTTMTVEPGQGSIIIRSGVAGLAMETAAENVSHFFRVLKEDEEEGVSL